MAETKGDEIPVILIFCAAITEVMEKGVGVVVGIGRDPPPPPPDVVGAGAGAGGGFEVIGVGVAALTMIVVRASAGATPLRSIMIFPAYVPEVRYAQEAAWFDWVVAYVKDACMVLVAVVESDRSQ